MATRVVETGTAGSRRVRAICALAACMLLGLGLWRGAAVFTQPAETPLELTQQQQTLIHVLEPIAGNGNVRVTVRSTGRKTRDILVLFDTTGSDAAQLASDIEAMLGAAIGFDATAGDTLTVREFPFVGGSSAAPQMAELAELGVIGLLIFLLSWGAFAPQKYVPEAAPNRSRSRKLSEDRPPRTRPMAVDLSAPGSKSASAAKTANEDPSGTAKVIRAWMRAPEGQS